MKRLVMLALFLGQLSSAKITGSPGEDFTSAMFGDIGAVQLDKCHHPVFTRSAFSDALIECAVFDGSFSDFHKLWDAYSSLNASKGSYDLVDLTPWRQKGEDGEYQRIYEIDGHRYIISFLPINGANEVTIIYNPNATGTGKSDFVDTFTQKVQDPANFLSLVTYSINEIAKKNHLVPKKCPVIKYEIVVEKALCYSTTQSLSTFEKGWKAFPQMSINKAGKLTEIFGWGFNTAEKGYTIDYAVGDHHFLGVVYYPKSKTRVTPFISILLTKSD